MTLAAGIHDAIPAELYHQDPCETPSLSASLANILISKSPAHAAAAHPKLSPGLERAEEAKFDVGTTVHALLLQGEDLAVACPYPDWRTKEAREQRDQLRAEGRIPLLVDQYDRVQAMVAAAREHLAQHDAQPPLFVDGKPEQTLVWDDNHGVTCRARLDWLHNDHVAVDDLKSSSRTADPAGWARSTLFSIGGALQARFYQRGVEKITGKRPSFRFAVVETEPPYAVSVVSLAPSAEALADAQIDHALATWARCIETGEWPAYTRQVAYAEAPTWLEMEWLAREVAA